MDNNNQITRSSNDTDVKGKGSFIDDLVDALFLDDFNQIISNYTNSELDFQTVVLFIKLYMMAYKVTGDADIDAVDRSQNIKDVIHYIMENSSVRAEIVRSFNDQTIIKTFFDKIKKIT